MKQRSPRKERLFFNFIKRLYEPLLYSSSLVPVQKIYMIHFLQGHGVKFAMICSAYCLRFCCWRDHPYSLFSSPCRRRSTHKMQFQTQISWCEVESKSDQFFLGIMRVGLIIGESNIVKCVTEIWRSCCPAKRRILDAGTNSFSLTYTSFRMLRARLLNNILRTWPCWRSFCYCRAVHFISFHLIRVPEIEKCF